jgi:hypothetical protein
MPAVGFANDHEIAVVVAAAFAGLVSLLEMWFVLRLLERSHLLEKGRALLRWIEGKVPGVSWVKQRLFKPKQAGRIEELIDRSRKHLQGGPRGYLALCVATALPVGAGLWLGLSLAKMLELSLWRSVTVLSLANGALFGVYYTYAGSIAWYIVGASLAIIALKLVFKMSWQFVSRRRLQLQPI